MPINALIAPKKDDLGRLPVVCGTKGCWEQLPPFREFPKVPKDLVPENAWFDCAGWRLDGNRLRLGDGHQRRDLAPVRPVGSSPLGPPKESPLPQIAPFRPYGGERLLPLPLLGLCPKCHTWNVIRGDALLAAVGTATYTTN
jgi:hypothetical protein